MKTKRLLNIEVMSPQKHISRENYNQYFTPEFAVEKALSHILGKINPENIIDPAVGNGVFLKVASMKWQKAKLFGIDIDKEIYKSNKANLSNFYFVCGDSFLQKTWQVPEIQKVLSSGGFDLVIGNPPFSSRFHRIQSKDILSGYEVGRNNGYLKRSQAIEILFLELFVRLTKGKGFIVIVLPDGILSNPRYQYIREFILRKTKVLDIINLPRSVFKETSAKTSILILKKQEMNNLNYFTKLHDLEKTGIVNNTIKISGENLLKRMDYHYYHILGENPLQKLIGNGVIFKQLKDFVIYCKTGKTLYGEEKRFSQKGLKFIHTTNIRDICISHEKGGKFIKPKSKMDFKSAHTRIDDILVARVGNGCVGRCGIVASSKGTGIVSDCIFIIKVREISPYFVTVFLKTNFAKKWFNAIKHGSAATSITKGELLSISIPVLHKNSQKAIEKQYKKIITRFHKNGNAKDLEIYQSFEGLVKKLEAKINNA